MRSAPALRERTLLCGDVSTLLKEPKKRRKWLGRPENINYNEDEKPARWSEIIIMRWHGVAGHNPMTKQSVLQSFVPPRDKLPST